ncbi:CyP450 monooxygenase [Phlebopus sp. FC_14]|nr:CyP450 monooxygenase [Phlebopus sp. FC_14]
MDVSRPQILLLPVVCAVGVLSVILIAVKSSRRRQSTPLPPGPSFLYAAKSLLTLDPSQPWLLFTRWNKRYGHLVYFDAGRQVLVTDSLAVARDLLEKRSSKYSDRPYFPSLSLYGWGFTTGLLNYSDKWRQHRRFHQQGFRPEAVLNWYPFQLQKVHTLLLNLLASPEQMVDHLDTFIASTIMAATYGYTTLPHKDPLLDIVNHAIVIFIQSTSLIKVASFTFFPFLKYLPRWLPGLSFYRDAPVSRHLARKMLDSPFEFVKQSMADGSAQPSLVSEFLSRSKEAEGNGFLDEEIIKEVAASALTAGFETTASTLVAFFMAMAMHPEIQERAQAEIDEVLRRERLPNFDDRDSLPYVEAVLRELYRSFPVIPIGAPHVITEDDVYNGLFIPKKTLVMANVWAIGHDESNYEDPHTFNPSRFLTQEGKLNDDNVHYVFGFGRRICPGRYLAEASLWIAIASVLAVFQIRKAKNELGEDIDVRPRFTTGQVVRPAPFKCEIVPRSGELERLVKVKS